MRKIGKMVSGAAVLLMLAAACGGKEGRGADFSEGKNRDIEVIDIDKAKREKALLYSSILEEPDVIVLETNPECERQNNKLPSSSLLNGEKEGNKLLSFPASQKTIRHRCPAILYWYSICFYFSCLSLEAFRFFSFFTALDSTGSGVTLTSGS